MNAKDIQNLIKGLYKDVEPDHFLADDQRILSYEQRAINLKERYNTDLAFREKMQNAMASRDDEWRENVAKNGKIASEKRDHDTWVKKIIASRGFENDPEYRAAKAERNRQMAKDPKWREAFMASRAGLKDKNSDWYKNIKKANQLRSKLQATEGTPERENFMAGRRKMQEDINWRINNAKAKGGLPVNTPWGLLYLSVNMASEDSANHGKHYSSKVIRSRAKQNRDGFSFATWEEFEKSIQK
jgi:hypothetical protein